MDRKLIITSAEEATHITHGGVFHADEVLATVMFRIICDDMKLARVYKVPEETNAVIYDIGGGDFDHHQKGGNGARENGVPYASAGLVWRQYGHKIMLAYGCPEEMAHRAVNLVDENLIQSIDASDNGYYAYPEEAGTQARFRLFTMSEAIAFFNPTWDAGHGTDEPFCEACAFAANLLEKVIIKVISDLKAENIVKKAIESSEGHIMVLDRFAPWQEVLLGDASEHAADIWYTIYPSIRGGYNIQGVPTILHGFDQRHPFPVSWRGDAGATGIKDCVFVHPNGFLAACETLEGAMELARKACKE